MTTLADLDKPLYTVSWTRSYAGAVAGYINDMWKTGDSGWPRAASANPSTGSGDALDNTSFGALPLPPVAGGQNLYMTNWTMAYSNQRIRPTYVYDRLVQTSGLDASITTLQNVNTVALPTRGGTGTNVMMMLSVYTGVGSTNPNMTINYTDSAGVAQVATAVNWTNLGALANFMVPLTAGAGGVQSVQSVQLGVSSGLAGNFGITLFKIIAALPEGMTRRPFDLGLPKVDPTSCLSFFSMSDSNSASNTVIGEMQFLVA